MEARWVLDIIDFESYLRERMNRPSASQIKDYYKGFKRRKPMYDDELKDLEKVYVKGLNSIHAQLNEQTPRLIRFMKEFIALHEQGGEIKEKLENLQAKMNPEDESEEDDE